jgi:hypothetical protein
MAFPAILGRWLDREVINLGVSGNGRMEMEVVRLLTELDACVFVIDCLGNIEAPQITERTEPLVRTLREARPRVPIVLVEDPRWPNLFVNEGRQRRSAGCRAALRKAYENLVAAGDKNLTYMSGDDLLAADGEGTVDGSHPTDLGFVQHAEAYLPVLEKVLGK